MSEKFPVHPSPQAENPAASKFEVISTAHDEITGSLREQLQTEHAALLYHDPAHTWGENLKGTEGGVVGNVTRLLQAMRTPLLEIVGQDQEVLHRYYAWELGVTAGAAAHDVVMESTVIEDGDQKKIERIGGWQEGKNEYESFQKLKEITDEYVSEDTEYKTAYLTAAESAIKATIPNATSFVSFNEETIHDLPEVVQESLRTVSQTGDVQYLGLRLDSQHANESLGGLLLSTADLAAARSPDIFFKTGNAEFWESQLPQTLAAIEVLETATVKRTTAYTLLQACTKWRQTQVGVALWQRERLKERFTTENIQRLLTENFELSIPNDICENVAQKCKELFLSGMTDSVVDAANKHQDFIDRYQIAETGSETLDPQERLILNQALQFMGADLTKLQAYISTLSLN